jgi:8-oxo-dGTP pyrophosphatase MutT (NUDIX family)
LSAQCAATVAAGRSQSLYADRAASNSFFVEEKRPISRISQFKRFLFSVLSHTGVAIYSRVPIFGHLRAAVAILKQGELYLLIERNDGRGYSFPGGLSMPWETADQAMRREVLEETGLEIGKSRLLFEYRASHEVPCILSVFEAEASGKLADSWEGSPRWLSLNDVKDRMLPSQREIINRMR